MERATVEGKIKHIAVDRTQIELRPFELDSLIDQQHPARVIWEVSEKFDLRRFEEAVKTRQGQAGRPCWPARVLVCVWVYGYTIGVASARALERMMSHEPGLRWLSGDQEINYHTLADFRVGHEAALKELFAQFLAVLETAGMVELKTLLIDGTKVKTVAGKWSFHGRKTVEKRLREARQVVKKLDRQAEAGEGEGVDKRRKAAQERAAKERVKRAEAALEELKKLEKKARPEKRDEQRASVSEAESHKMKQPDGGWAPSYNLQVTTEARSRMIVAVGISTAANDLQELEPALEKVKENCGKLPKRVIADTGYATRNNVEKMAGQKLVFIAPWKEDESREAGACKRNGIDPKFAPSAFRLQRCGKKLRCPAGKTLVLIGQRKHHKIAKNVYQAKQSDCSRCGMRRECCGERSGSKQIRRVVETEAMKKYLARMERPKVKELYRKRSEIAEFPHLWAKAMKGWRRFSVRGVVKASIEATWVALAYNVAQWTRLRQPKAQAA